MYAVTMLGWLKAIFKRPGSPDTQQQGSTAEDDTRPNKLHDGPRWKGRPTTKVSRWNIGCHATAWPRPAQDILRDAIKKYPVSQGVQSDIAQAAAVVAAQEAEGGGGNDNEEPRDVQGANDEVADATTDGQEGGEAGQEGRRDSATDTLKKLLRH